jgi:putative transposase
MDGYGDICTGRHCVSVPHAHLVLVTKHRQQVFTAAHLQRLEQIMRDVCADSGTGLTAFNGQSSHVHPLASFPPTATSSPGQQAPRAPRHAGCGQEFPRLGPALLAAWTGYGPGRTSPDRPAPRSASCTSTSNSRTSPPDLSSGPPPPRPEGRRTSGHPGGSPPALCALLGAFYLGPFARVASWPKESITRPVRFPLGACASVRLPRR